MVGFVEHHRSRMRDDLKLFAGGDLVFREKWLGSRDEAPRSWGALDAAALDAARVETWRVRTLRAHRAVHIGPDRAAILSSACCPTRWSSRPRRSLQRLGVGAARLVPRPPPRTSMPTCYVVEGRAARGDFFVRPLRPINTIRTAMAVANVGKLHAVIGGSISASRRRLRRDTIAELKGRSIPILCCRCTAGGRAFPRRDGARVPTVWCCSNTGSRSRLRLSPADLVGPPASPLLCAFDKEKSASGPLAPVLNIDARRLLREIRHLSRVGSLAVE